MNDSASLKKTALHEIHVALGAKMVPFAGYDLPVQYAGLSQEHHCVRDHVGLFDVSHMGEFVVKGPDAEALVEWICSNHIGKMVDMQAQYNCMPNLDGGIVDDLIVYRWDNTEYNLVVNASNIDKDWAWITSQIEAKSFDVEMTNISDELSLLALQGPKATELLQTLTDIDLSSIAFYHFGAGSVAGVEDVIISNTGYTGSGGFELYVWNKDAAKLWDALMSSGETFQIQPCGLGARDTLRLEKGFCLYGNDINDTTSPIEAGLGWITKFDAPFVNSEYHLNIKENKPQKRLVGFELLDRGIPRQHYDILSEDGEVIGEVTSGTQSPSLGKAIGMGYIKRGFGKAGTPIKIQIRKNQVNAVVTKMPFLK